MISADAMSEWPFASERTAVKVWLTPLPELGVSELTVGAAGAPFGFHVPAVIQPELSPDESEVVMYTVLLPENAAVNDSGSVKVSVLPAPEAPSPVPESEQFGLETVLAVPGVSESQIPSESRKR